MKDFGTCINNWLEGLQFCSSDDKYEYNDNLRASIERRTGGLPENEISIESFRKPLVGGYSVGMYTITPAIGKRLISF